MGPISSRQSPFVAGASPNVKKPVKMVMCVNFNNSGHCDRGETCTYAHGLDELHEYRMKQVRRTNVLALIGAHVVFLCDTKRVRVQILKLFPQLSSSSLSAFSLKTLSIPHMTEGA